MINRQIIKDLESILNNNIDETMFPYKKGNSIRIGHIAIRKTKKDYVIFDCKDNAMIARTFCKTSAVALARSLIKGNDKTEKILAYDRDIEKHYNDCIFYRYTIEKTDSDFKREITINRYEISRAKTEQIKSKLDHYIFF